MGKRKVVVKESAAESIATVAWFIESQGLIATAEKWVDRVYDFLLKWQTIGNLTMSAEMLHVQF
ncbi:hypothetical protein [Paraflavitalea speifideaquila]|uniref:hypothetical protein n=1 Tax=Paraflavitalea speifideaquila TaxID=3076558 RepID=UPI0028E50477|nr:hypothetical protein [Paraflavitalea speifideiaquila]